MTSTLGNSAAVEPPVQAVVNFHKLCKTDLKCSNIFAKLELQPFAELFYELFLGKFYRPEDFSPAVSLKIVSVFRD